MKEFINGEFIGGTPAEGERYRLFPNHEAGTYVEKRYKADESLPPHTTPTVKVSNITLNFTGFNRLGLGDIYTINPSSSINIEADVALPNTVMTIMFVELGTNDEWLNAKYRFDATIQDGKLNLPIKLPVGNFILSCKRINQGLDYVNAGFHLEFEDIQFNCIVEV